MCTPCLIVVYIIDWFNIRHANINHSVPHGINSVYLIILSYLIYKK